MTAEWDNATPASVTRNAKRETRSMDRPPPHDEASEHGVLGCVLLGGRETFLEAVEVIQSPGFFYTVKGQLLWQVLLEMDADNKPLDDLVLVNQQLKARQQSDEMGGIPFLNELATGVPYASRVLDYAEV